eukprot:5970959-Prymnesium_polylepis.1
MRSSRAVAGFVNPTRRKGQLGERDKELGAAGAIGTNDSPVRLDGQPSRSVAVGEARWEERCVEHAPIGEWGSVASQRVRGPRGAVPSPTGGCAVTHAWWDRGPAAHVGVLAVGECDGRLAQHGKFGHKLAHRVDGAGGRLDAHAAGA